MKYNVNNMKDNCLGLQYNKDTYHLLAYFCPNILSRDKISLRCSKSLSPYLKIASSLMGKKRRDA